MNYYTLILVSLFLLIAACKNQVAVPVKSDENKMLNNQETLGVIQFSILNQEEVKSRNLSEKSVIDLTGQSNIWITIKHPQPLVSYLQKLNPDASIAELCSSGNYYFTFYVDGNKIYEQALNFGAGTLETKSNNTEMSVPLASTRGEDSWGRYLWMRFMLMGGGEDALYNEGKHTLKIEVRPYTEIPDQKIGKLMAKGEVTLNVIKPTLTKSQIEVQAIADNSGWQHSSSGLNNTLIEELNKRIGQRYFKDITSIVVIKNEELLLEEYFNEANRATLHNPRSVGKTFASTLMGMAIEDGHIESVDAELGDFYDLSKFENYAPVKEKVTIKSLLKMSSGFDADDDDWDSPGNEENMYPTDDWVKFALDLPMDKNKTIGANWNYFTAGIVVLGDILNQHLPGGMDDYADKHLFSPLGIEDYKWQYTPTNVPNTAGGIQLRSLDFAKYGQLYKNKGQWKGQQILSEQWVAESLFPHATLPQGGHYGYLFWNHSYEVNGKSYEAYYCSGNGGNKIFIFKDIPVVIVITATAYNMPYAHPQVNKILREYLLPAILD